MSCDDGALNTFVRNAARPSSRKRAPYARSNDLADAPASVRCGRRRVRSAASPCRCRAIDRHEHDERGADARTRCASRSRRGRRTGARPPRARTPRRARARTSPVANARAPSGASSTAAMPATIEHRVHERPGEQLRAGEHLERRRERGERGWPRTRRRAPTRIRLAAARAGRRARWRPATPARRPGRSRARRRAPGRSGGRCR